MEYEIDRKIRDWEQTDHKNMISYAKSMISLSKSLTMLRGVNDVLVVVGLPGPLPALDRIV